MTENPPLPSLQRLCLSIRGTVQGVGFRPFVYRLARSLALKGWVKNNRQGVFMQVEGAEEVLTDFLLRLEKEKPPRASIQSLESATLDPVGFHSFEILPSDEDPDSPLTALVLPDIATCLDCRAEIFDPRNRRCHYPFTNCTNCGPRFSIIEALPYDRAHTTMRSFAMCADCQREYEDPLDRRFHAQPNACPACGPQLSLWNAQGEILAGRQDALHQAAAELRKGKIIAIKGLGGFHLMVDARNPGAVAQLRERKHREEKPFALLFPSLDAVNENCRVGPLEERLLLSPESPIVLLRKKGNYPTTISDLIAPANPYLGVMLPYTPLHHLLMEELGFPVVATSGNLSDEPICTDEKEALRRLAGIADCYLVHNRPIARHVDDSIVRIVLDRELVLRRARGFAPLPVSLKNPCAPILAVGAHLKNTVAISVGRDVFVSQHVGDLENSESLEAFEKVVTSFKTLYSFTPSSVACDLHPDYLSTRQARRFRLPLKAVQHHYAHIAACMAENQLEGEVLGVSWDGTGYGTDGTVWGGEFLRCGPFGFRRQGHLRTFALPGGEKAVREPRRSALGLLYEIFGDLISQEAGLAPLKAFSETEFRLLCSMMKKNLNSPRTSSAGRLFDAVASLLDLRQRVRFEGQAAMELEFACDGADTEDTYELHLLDSNEGEEPSWIVDWEPLIRGLLRDAQAGAPCPLLALRFHHTLAESIVQVAQKTGLEKVVLSGGCFQNQVLTVRAVERLKQAGFRPYWHQRIPPNDGGISLGQIAAIGEAK